VHGFEVILGKHLQDQYGYLSKQDRDRAADINEMFGRSDIWAASSRFRGYGCCRLPPHSDYDLIRRNPKVLIGHKRHHQLR
jgi:muramoyltetrapeptide carboxypeptidase